jgi:hypothetical protein
MQILVGADPELFVRNPNNMQFVSGHGLVPGTKLEPFKVDRGAVQVDGMALEFNIDPAATANEFFMNINTVRDRLQRMVPGYELVADPVAEFGDEYMRTQPPEALELGCEPDYCAWTGKANERPDGNVSFRSGAGHIHIGWTDGADTRSVNHLADCVAMAKQMDYYLGIYSLLWDGDNRRRSLYGKAGAFRPKPYGVEYRTLSNAWLRDPRMIRWVYHATVRGAEDLAAGKSAVDKHGDLAREVIDTNVTDWPNLYQLNIPVAKPPGLGDQKVA